MFGFGRDRVSSEAQGGRSKGRRFALLAGTSSLLAAVILGTFGWSSIAETWYLWRLQSGSAEVRTQALHSLSDVVSMRSVVPLIEVIRSNVYESAYVFDCDVSDDLRMFSVVLEDTGRSKVFFREYGWFSGYRIEEDSPRLFLTPAAYGLYCVGNDALPAMREAAKGNNERVSRTLKAVAGALARPRKETRLCEPADFVGGIRVPMTLDVAVQGK